MNVFTVEIQKDSNVSQLKDIIKEKKKHAFKHVDADTLELRKVRPEDSQMRWLLIPHSGFNSS